MKILIIGDCHGNWLPVIRAIRQARKELGIGAAIQVGDFGLYPRGVDQLFKSSGFAIPVYVIDGNHENHEYIAEGLDHLHKYRLFYQPRGTVLELDGMKIGFCGGALNVDRPQECDWPARKHRTLPEDARWTSWLTMTQAERAAEAFNQVPLDLLITHSCPSNIGVGQKAHPGLMAGEQQFIRVWGVNPGPPHDVGEPGLTHLWNKLRHKPANWVYGHFHECRQQQVEQTTFTCVGSADHSDGFHGVVPWIYDTLTETLEIVGEARLTG